MSKDLSKIETEFGPDTRFEMRPAPAAPFVATEKSRFELLKNTLLASKLVELWQPEFNGLVRRAANEAAALAWLTSYPALFFPALFEEKTETALHVADHQAEVSRRSRELLAA